MKKDAKAATSVAVKNLLNVKATKQTTKKFNPQDAEVVEAIEEVKEPSSEKAKEAIGEESAPQQPKTLKEEEPTERPQEVAPIEQKKLTLEELKDVATQLFYLQEKHSQISEKRAMLNHFAISHDDQNATVIVSDANGMQFKSSSPKTVGKLLEFWKEEFDEAKKTLETKMQGMFLDSAI